MNKVLLTGRLTRDPELRSLASGSSVATFAVATNEFRGKNGKERSEFHNVVVWDRLAQVCGQYLGKGQQVAIEGRLQTRQWDDDRGARHWKTEVVATSVEMLSGRRKRDYEADSLVAQANSDGATDETSGISPNEAAEVGVMTMADAAVDESGTADDEQVLVLA
jgi:single-strand DNA-binding protein